MTLKYESELLFDLMKRDGDDAPSDVLPYESELKEKYLNQVVGAYPKLQDYRAEWLHYKLYQSIPSDFPIESVANVTSASFNNVVPYAYKSAILKGSTKYRDIDTGEFLETFEEGRNLELVSVRMPVLMTTGKNLCDTSKYIQSGISENTMVFRKDKCRSYYMKCKPSTTYIISVENSNNRFGVASSHLFSENTTFKLNKYWSATSSSDLTGQTLQHTFTTTEKDKYLYVYVANNGVFNPNIRVQVEEGSSATTYEPFKSNILTVNEDVTLRGIDEVKDELDLVTGEVTKRIGEVVFDGSEDWIVSAHVNSTMFYTSFNNLVHKKYYLNSMSCDKFVVHTNEMDLFNSTSLNGISAYNDYNGAYPNENWIYIKYADSEGSVGKLKQWLSQNPITVQYELAQESTKTVDLSCINEQGKSETFRPIEGTMHVSTSSQTLPPLLDMSVPVEATSQNLMSFANMIEEEK